MLTIIASLAMIALTILLNITAWMSISPRPWLYDLLAGVLIYFWAQPWRSRDRYRTDSRVIRRFSYLAIIGISLSNSVLFTRAAPLLLMIETVILGIIEWRGQNAVSEE